MGQSKLHPDVLSGWTDGQFRRRYATVLSHGGQPGSLENDEISRERLHKVGKNGYSRKSFDIMSAFFDVLGKAVFEVPENYERGELLIDTAMDLETNATKGLVEENTMVLQRGQMPEDAIVKIAQTFRSGTNYIDAIDFVDMFWGDEQQISLDDLNIVSLFAIRSFASRRCYLICCSASPNMPDRFLPTG
jgi:hypothetical protein